ncbi:class I SAM-dependent methyltransferase [Salinarimonas sp.]|uniref:class I SAM-dependent methyltransferase n=1 Tax=Salinarimonas sp. TaxID=2766526 RepID=UPI00391B0901
MDTRDVARLWEENAPTWTRLVRAGHDRCRDVLNMPAFLAMLPPVAGLEGLDLGCGEGAGTRAVAGLGARMTGIDIAPSFVRLAQASEREQPLGIAYHVADAAALPFPPASFDFATAFMSLMDMPDQARALAEAQRVLRPGGFLQFSILHPCFMPPRHRNVRDAAGELVAIEIGGYFEETEGRVETWTFSTLSPEERDATKPFRVPRFHATLSTWFSRIAAAGLVVEALGEPRASLAEATAEPVVADTRIAPIFLHLRCVRPR